MLQPFLKLVLNLIVGTTYAQSIDHEITVTPSDPQEETSEFTGQGKKSLQRKDLPKGKSSVQDVLQELPGVYSTRGMHSHDPSQMTIRGFAGPQIRVFRDGLPLNSSFETAASFENMSLSNIQSVEMTPGAWTTSGIPSMGGTIELFTHEKDKNKISLLGGSYETVELSGQIKKKIKKHHVGLSGLFYDSRGLLTVPNPKYDELSDPTIAPSVQMRIQQRETLQASIAHSFRGSTFKTQSSLEWKSSTQGMPGTMDRPFDAVTEKEMMASGEFHIKDIQISKRAQIKAHALLRGRRTQSLDPLGEISGIVSTQTFDHTYGTLGASPEIILSDHFRLQTPLSAQIEKSKFESQKASRNHFLLNPTLHIFMLNDRMVLSPTLTVWKVTTHQAKFLPGIAARFDILNTLSILGKFSLSQRLPTFQELHFSNGFIAGNPQLKPEKTIGGDIGLKYKPTDKFTFQLAYFEYRIKDLIEYSLSSGFQYKPFNFTRAESRGVETQINIQPVSWFRTDHALTFQHMVNSNVGAEFSWNRIPNRPRFFGRSSAKFSYKNTVSVRETLNYALSRITNRSNTDTLPDRFSWDQSIDFTYQKITVSFEIQNLLNRINYDQFRFPTQGRSFYGKVSANF